MRHVYLYRGSAYSGVYLGAYSNLRYIKLLLAISGNKYSKRIFLFKLNNYLFKFDFALLFNYISSL